MNFKEKLKHIVNKNNSLLCIGLDIDKEKIPQFLLKKNQNPLFEFNKTIIDATKDLICAYKLNLAFYETLGTEGFKLLEKTIKYIPKDIIIILDGKRNDIGNTAQKYAEAMFKTLKADATTVNPYLGIDGIQPFLKYKNKCTFILCRTSNPSAKDIQDLKTKGKPLYQHIANKIKEWNTEGNCGAIAGATYPHELKTIREILGEDIPILIPGIGKQGGNIKKTVKNGTNSKGEMAIINSSRSIIFAGSNENYKEKTRETAEKLKNEINKYR
ncbi:MAG: orotidine-5'-phosphate decarboxylase [Thermoplasmata archaeon]|nr:MAG: orotidine-5'-phosphate decarboxylase [Thermoplasmata archaeon]